MRIPGVCCRSFGHDVALSPSPGYLYNDPMGELVHVRFATVVPAGEPSNHSIFGPVPASHAHLGFTLLTSCGTRLSSLGDGHRTGFIPNTSAGLLKLLESVDASPRRQPRDRQPHHKGQYRNL
jgi:hypothetical protein